MDETKPLIPIFLHEYQITRMEKQKSGVQQIKIIVQTETEENQQFEAVEQAIKMLDGENLNISHRILLTGYRES